MDKEEREKLLTEDIRTILIEMHKGGSLVEALKKIKDLVKGIKYMEDKKFLFLLDGLMQQKLEGKALLEKDRQFIEGFNESAEENNFAVKLAIDAVIDSEDK